MRLNANPERLGPDPILALNQWHEVKGGSLLSFTGRFLAGIAFGALAWLLIKSDLREASPHPPRSRETSIIAITGFTLVGLGFVFDAFTRLILACEGAWQIRPEMDAGDSSLRLHWRRPSGFCSGGAHLDLAIAGDRILLRSSKTRTKVRKIGTYYHEFRKTYYYEFWSTPSATIEAADHRRSGSFAFVIPPEIRMDAANHGHAAQWTLRLKFRRARWLVSTLNFHLPLPDPQD